VFLPQEYVDHHLPFRQRGAALAASADDHTLWGHWFAWLAFGYWAFPLKGGKAAKAKPGFAKAAKLCKSCKSQRSWPPDVFAVERQ
jgi:hypothetical protein